MAITCNDSTPMSEDPRSLVGLPWQLAETLLQAASIPFKTMYGNNYNRYFSVVDYGPYVGRVTKNEEGYWDILLYYPMVCSDFRLCNEVEYAPFSFEKEKNE